MPHADLRTHGLLWRGYCVCDFVTSAWLLSANGAWAELTLHRIGHDAEWIEVN